MGALAIRRGDYRKAALHFEEALIYNGGDALAWMMKAACLRHLGMDEEAAFEKGNAYVLAPLEPLHRAEAFLIAGTILPRGELYRSL